MTFLLNRKNKIAVYCIFALLLMQSMSYAQFKAKWMTAGSLKNWYSEIGCEIEEGFVAQQQYGMMWPALYNYQSIQAWKGMWFGVKDFKDEKGENHPFTVVHVGPRVSGAGEFIPVTFKMKSKFPAPAVTVDGAPSSGQLVDIDEIDPTMVADREIYTVVSSKIGLTLTRRVMQFSEQNNENYIVNEYILKNTGDIDGNLSTVELPNNVLKDLRFFFQYRLAPCAETRYVIDNSTGWGTNTTYDTRGDGKYPDPAGEDFRAQFAWHGKFPGFTNYDNVGGPIWTTALNVDKGDTVGRLGAPQFAGVANLFVSQAPNDFQNDDPNQPSTTKTFFSDDYPQRNNFYLNSQQCADEYAFMSTGHDRRHLDKMGEPVTTYSLLPQADPKLGNAGGLSMGDGYGPYTLQPGDSLRLVFVEAVNGISREKAIEIGKKYKADYKAAANQAAKEAATMEKNRVFYTGKDSLFKTFRYARENFQSGWRTGQGIRPPKEFSVNGLGDRVALTWSLYEGEDANVTGFRVYRAMGRLDSTYRKIADLPADARSFDDRSTPRGVNVYYYVQAVGNVGGRSVVSNRYYSQTYDPTYLKRQPGASMNDIRVVPNPFNLGADANELRFPEKRDRLFFYNVPGNCTIQIFTEYGELIKTIEHNNGSGDQEWDCQTSSNQIVVSGIYIAVVRNNDTGDSKVLKFVVIR